MSNHIKITILDWMCNESRLLEEIKSLYEEDDDIGEFTNNSTDGDRRGIYFKTECLETAISELLEDLRLKFDVMLIGDENEMIISVDKKGKRFRCR